MREYEYERESNWFQLVAGESQALAGAMKLCRNSFVEIARDMKTRGPLYKLAGCGVEPRGGEAPPHPRRFPTNSNFHHSPHPHPVCTTLRPVSIPAYDLGILPKHLRPSQNTYRFSPLSQNT
jgi:hypothetical protein